jgi:hypothetical protein
MSVVQLPDGYRASVLLDLKPDTVYTGDFFIKVHSVFTSAPFVLSVRLSGVFVDYSVDLEIGSDFETFYLPFKIRTLSLGTFVHLSASPGAEAVVTLEVNHQPSSYAWCCTSRVTQKPQPVPVIPLEPCCPSDVCCCLFNGVQNADSSS